MTTYTCWDNAHVVTCNRDRWQFERQIILLNALNYPGVLRVYVNEYDEACSSWHVWFKNVRRECNRIFRRNIRVTDVEAIPGMSLAEHQHRSGEPKFLHYYVQQQLVKLYDVHTHGDAISLDSKTWPIHPNAFAGTVGMPLDQTYSIIDTPFHATTAFAHAVWNIPEVTHLGANLPPVYVIQNRIHKFMHNWMAFVKQFHEFDWKGHDNIISEYWLYQIHNNYNVYGQPTGRCRTKQITLDQWNGCTTKLSHILQENHHHWITVKWHHPPELALVKSPDNVFKQLLEHAHKHKRPRC